jgi:hypothetical protein
MSLGHLRQMYEEKLSNFSSNFAIDHFAILSEAQNKE